MASFSGKKDTTKNSEDDRVKRRSIQLPPPHPQFSRQSEYDKLAAILRTHLDIPYLKQILLSTE